MKLSGHYTGVKYPNTTREVELDRKSTNCFAHQSGANATYVKCGGWNTTCFLATLFTFQSFNSMWEMKRQQWGCWLNSSQLANPNCSSSCLFNGRNQSVEFLSFCTCAGSLCNTMDLLQTKLNNSTICRTIPDLPRSAVFSRAPGTPTLFITIGISLASVVFIVICLVVLPFLKEKEKGRTECTQIELTHTLSTAALYDIQNDNNDNDNDSSTMENLLYGKLIFSGNHSEIRLGAFGGETIAAKIVSSKCASQFVNEVEIFKVLGEEPNIAKFIDSYEAKGIILLAYYPAGSLLHFIRKHILTWRQTIKIVHSIVHGLLYLHENVKHKCDMPGKPGIAHRDLNSRNILMKLDGTCVLADFGFAVKLVGDPCSLHHVPVGSPRYMAPEVLSQREFTRNWKTCLKQIDVYAFGLVLWEVCTSCDEMCLPGSVLPPCFLPYEEELGSGPSLNKVKNYVCDQRRRPKIPEQWDPDNVDVHSMKNIIRECWRSDSTSRPESHIVLNALKFMLDETGRSTPAMEMNERTALNSNCDLYFKIREERNSSIMECTCDETGDISDALLMNGV